MLVYKTRFNSLNVMQLLAWDFHTLFCDGFNLFPQSLHSAFKCKQPLLHYTSMKHAATKGAESDKGDIMGQMLTLMGAAERFGM